MIEIELPQGKRKSKPAEWPKKPRKKKRGRSRKRTTKPPRAKEFRDTPLGKFLYTNCPIEWKLIADAIGFRYADSKTDVYERICMASDNPIFKTAEFRRVLGDFRRYGMHSPNQSEYTIADELEKIKANIGG